LLEYETLSGVEVNALLKGEPILRPDADDDNSDGHIKASVPTSGAALKKDKDKGKGLGGGLTPEPQPEG